MNTLPLHEVDLVQTQRAVLNDVVSADAITCLLLGLDGSGKSTLLSQLEQLLRERGYSTTVTTGVQLGSLLAHGTSDGIRAVPDVLIVDDAHEAAPGSLRELTESRRVAGQKTILAWDSIHRPVDLPRGFVAHLGAWRLAELECASRGWGHGRFDEELAVSSGGNPGLLRWMLGDRVTELQTPAPRFPNFSSAPVLRTLSSRQIALLKVGALIGPSFRLDAIAHGLNWTWVELADEAAQLLQAGIVTSSETELTFAHPLLAATLRDSVALPERLARSRAIATRLITTNESAETACRYIVSASWFSEETLAWTLDKAPDMSVKRPEVVVPVLEGFLKHLALSDERRSSIQTWLAQSLFQLGRMSEVEQLVRQLLSDGHAGSAELPLRLNLSGALLLGNNVTQALGVLGDRANLVVADDREQNNLRAVRSLHRILAGDIAGGASEARLAARTGRVLGDTLGVSVALSALSHVAYYEGDVNRATTLAAEAVENADRSDSHEAPRRARYELGMFNMHADREREAREVFESEVRRSEEDTTSKWYRPLPLIGLGLLDFQQGHWDSAESRFEAALRFGEEVSTRWESAFVRAHLADMAVRRGDVTRAIGQLDLIEHRADDTPHQSFDAVLWAQATVALALGRNSEALELLAEASALVDQYRVVTRYRWLVPQVLRASCLLGRASEFEHLVDALDAVATKADVPYVRGAALLSRALLVGDPEIALQAVEALRNSHRRVDLADALVDAGRLLCQFARPDEAVEKFEEARDLYGSFGALAAHARIRSELRALGVASGASRRKKAPMDGPDSLTPAERRIVLFVAKGLTNGEIAQHLFISPRTVETHLTRCYAKLGISSRVALALFGASQVR